MVETANVYGCWIHVSTDANHGHATLYRLDGGRDPDKAFAASLLIPAEERDRVADQLGTFRWDERFAVKGIERKVIRAALRDYAAGLRSFIDKVGLEPTEEDQGVEDELAACEAMLARIGNA